MITAVVEKAMVMPVMDRDFPIKPSRPKVYNSARPPTTGGTTRGNRINARTILWPKNCTRASSNASGTPKKMHRVVLTAAVFRLNASAATEESDVTSAPN